MAVVTGVGKVLLLELKGSSLEEAGQLTLDAEIACIDLSPLSTWMWISRRPRPSLFTWPSWLGCGAGMGDGAGTGLDTSFWAAPWLSSG